MRQLGERPQQQAQLLVGRGALLVAEGLGKQLDPDIDMIALALPYLAASMASARLCGGMLVAMPTAMPPAPLTSRLGKRAGRTVGSSSFSS